MKPTRILLAKTAIDGHWRGISVVASALRDAGYEVIMVGMARVEEIVTIAVQEDVDLVGLNVGGHINGVKHAIAALRAVRPEVPIFVGGAVAPWAKRELEAENIEVYPPGSQLPDIVEAAGRLTANTH